MTKDWESASKEGLCSALSTLLLHKIMIKELYGCTLMVFPVKINQGVVCNSMLELRCLKYCLHYISWLFGVNNCLVEGSF